MQKPCSYNTYRRDRLPPLKQQFRKWLTPLKEVLRHSRAAAVTSMFYGKELFSPFLSHCFSFIQFSLFFFFLFYAFFFFSISFSLSLLFCPFFTTSLIYLFIFSIFVSLQLSLPIYLTQKPARAYFQFDFIYKSGWIEWIWSFFFFLFSSTQVVRFSSTLKCNRSSSSVGRLQILTPHAMLMHVMVSRWSLIVNCMQNQ